MTKLLALGLLALVGSAVGWKEQCQSFQDVGDHANVVAATYYNAGDLVNLTSLADSVTNSSLPAFCRLELRITTNEDSGSYAVTEVWLPDVWNVRMLGVGVSSSRSSPLSSDFILRNPEWRVRLQLFVAFLS